MRTEIKKNCIEIITTQQFNLFNAINTASIGLLEIDLVQNAALGSYVRFFEEAFEWEEMTWLTYPYFWGRKSTWMEHIAFEDPDPVFSDFFSAGYCWRRCSSKAWLRGRNRLVSLISCLTVHSSLFLSSSPNL